MSNENSSMNTHEDHTLPPSEAIDEEATVPPSSSLDQNLDTLAPQTESAWRVGGSIQYFGDYELIDEIARGGMGVVYRARQTSLNRVVALKMILSGQLAGEEEVLRFQTEAQAAANLDHPGIVPIYEIGEVESQHYFSMGFVDGSSLADGIAENPLPPKQAAALLKQICQAIEYAHQQGVVHRDLKPANILITKDGQPKVTDFGLAKATNTDSNLTGTGQILGTPSYMPPEQASGKVEQMGPPADVYALGAILYCTLTGHPPFQAASVMDTLMQVLEKEPVSPRALNSKVPKDLETIVLKCLQKDIRKRYCSAGELAQELDRYLRGEPILARPIGLLGKLWRWCRNHPRESVLMGILAAVTLVGAFLLVAAAGFAGMEHERMLKVRMLSSYRSQIDNHLAYNHPERAEKVLAEMSSEFPLAPETKEAFLNYALQAEGDQKVDAYAQQVLEMAPEDHFSMVLIGDRYFLEDRPQRALEFYEVAYEMNPDYQGTLFALGRDMVALERYADALPYLERLVNEFGAESSFFSSARSLSVEALVRLERVEQAEQELTSLLKDFPSDRRVLGTLCKFVALVPADKAETFLPHFDSLADEKAYFYVRLGDAFEREERFLEAERFFLKALDVDSQYLNAAFALGKLSVKTERWQDALKYFELAQSLDDQQSQTTSSILRGLIAAHLKLGNIQQAHQLADEMVEQYPEDRYLPEVLLEVADARVRAAAATPSNQDNP